MTAIPVKICGISIPETLQAAIDEGARFIGLVFYPPSPRHVSFDIAYNLARMIPTGVRTVGLFVDPTDEQLNHICGGIALDMIQLHGDESPERVAEIKNKFGLQIIKAFRINEANDFNLVEDYTAADWFLFDAKSETAKGGTGHSFDWSLLKDRTFSKPWMLSGGLNEKNITDALNETQPNAIDISSGVESKRGVKDAAKIKDFMDVVKNAAIKD